MLSSRISLIHPISNPFSRQAAIALSEADLLQDIITTLAYQPTEKGDRWLSLLPQTLKTRAEQELGRRTWIPPEGVPLRTHPWQEVLRLALVKTGLSKPLGLGHQGSVAWVHASLDHHVAKHHLQGLDAVYAYEDSAAETFQAAKQQDILCLYDLPIVFYRTSRAIQAEEAERFPNLAPALQAVSEPDWKLERKQQEIKLADHIFVPSSFVKNSLLEAGVEPDRVSVILFGSPIDYFQPHPKPDKIFRPLFVGRVGPRKGVHYLLEAYQELHLPEAELLLVGINEFPENWLAQYTDIVRHVPSVPHALLNQYYSSASVLVLPSLVEGLALVQLEAMACGVPIITTPNAGGSDIITNGVEGFIVPIRDVDALKEKLDWCYRHPQQLAEMGWAARQKAEQLNWSLYRQTLVKRVQEILSNHRC